MENPLNGLITKWYDGTIPNKSKGEVVSKFCASTGLGDNTRFYAILNKKVHPTVDELKLLTELITEYHDHHQALTEHEA